MTKYDKELQTGTPEYEESTEPLEDSTKQHPKNRSVGGNDEQGKGERSREKQPVRPD